MSDTRTEELTERLDLARAIAIEAGELTLKYFLQPELRVDVKGDDSPVTIADRQAETLMRERISARFPHDAILGEEHGRTAGTSPFEWVLDPIDGTKSFVAGVPLYTNLVAVLFEGEAVIGVINAPAAGEMAYAQTGGGGAWYQRLVEPPRQAQVSQVDRLDDALFVTTEVSGFATSRQAMPTYLQLQAATRLSRTWGDAYGYLLVATGRAEVMIDPAMNLWDAAAILPIIQEAGGTFTDWKGNTNIRAGEGIATNGRLLEQVIEYTKEN